MKSIDADRKGESARARAEESTLDQRRFVLEPGAYEQFVTMLDTPSQPSEAVRTLLSRKPGWETTRAR